MIKYKDKNVNLNILYEQDSKQESKNSNYINNLVDRDNSEEE